MNLNFYCYKCGSYLESPQFKNVDNNTVEFTIIPCDKCLKTEYLQGEKAAIIKIDLDKKLKDTKNMELMDLAQTTNYGGMKI